MSRDGGREGGVPITVSPSGSGSNVDSGRGKGEGNSLARATAGEQLAVDPAAIEQSLAGLWREEARASKGAVIRAALWNVVALSREEGECRRAAEVLSRVSGMVPQRSILVAADPASGDRLTSWISASCHRLDAERQMCSEQITIAAAGGRVRHLASLVRALLLPDMPVALWCLGVPPRERELIDLIETGERLMFDSRRFEDPAELERTLALARSAPLGAADLQWLRLEEWRWATAALFDCPGVAERARRLRSIHVRFASSAERRWGESAGGWLYAGWLAGQLELSTGAEGVSVRLEAEPGEEAGRLLSIELDLGDGAGITIEPSAGAVRAVPRGVRPAAPAVIRRFSSEPDHLVRRALARGERDLVYERALALAATMAGSRP
ncbi:MAG TPA: glucose-6-phosphate dehydrogenase assembly protein OpcA [Thermoanaerobaculia bacterium]|nr:glucose-6-phosphate dehydrogenase assembly protein OpcA [Thermoanaerobaculia bacterium]